MILSPDDHRSLQAIDGELATCEPHLAAMFKIFSRLNEEEAPPPSEDLIVAARPPAGDPASTSRRRRRSRAARARLTARGASGRGRARLTARGGPRGRLWGPMAAIAVPAVLLATLVMVVFFGLTSTIKCRAAPADAGTAARSTKVVMPGSSLRACPSSPKTAGAGGGNR